MKRLPSTDSIRLTLLRFPLIVGVVYIHNFDIYKDTRALTDDGGWASVFEAWAIGLTAQGVARLAVPIFFIIAGYLFFLGWQANAPSYGQALRKRVKTLLIPYLFWNGLVIALTVLVHSSSAGQSMLSGRFKSPLDFDAYEWTDAVFGLTRKPIAHHFWFIRDLMIMSLVSPLVYVAVKRLSWLLMVPMTAAWIFDAWPLVTPTLDGVLFFSFGCWAAVQQRSLFMLDRATAWLLPAYLALLAVSQYLGEQTGPGRWLHNAAILFGIPCALYLSGLAAGRPNWRGALSWLAPASFFVYAAHDPAIALLRKLALRLSGASEPLSVTLLYFLLPALLIAVLTIAYRMLDKLAPGMLSIVTGGR